MVSVFFVILADLEDGRDKCTSALIAQAKGERATISISNWSQIGPIFRRFERPPKRRITMKTEHAHGEGAVYQTAEGI